MVVVEWRTIMKNVKNIQTILLKRDGAQCSICGKRLTDENMCIDHIFPRGLGGSDNLDNLRLLCRECNCKYVNVAFSGQEFEKYIYEIIRKNENFRNVRLEENVSRDNSIDIFAERKLQEKWEKLAIEVEYATSFTIARVNLVVARLKEIQQLVSDIKCVFLFPGKLTEEANMILSQNEIEIWDGEYLASRFQSEINQTFHPVFNSLFNVKYNYCQKKEQIFIDKLHECKPGRENWGKYQNLIGEVLTFLFCPPLLCPISEKADASRTNRRDFIFPNYCDKGFWSYLQSRYSADYIVVDAKNYQKNITKREVLQIENYLKEHGPGLFGIIITRNGVSESALYTLKEVWAIHKKMIIILQDNDIEQMLLEKLANREPENIVRQKIEDFRLLI